MSKPDRSGVIGFADAKARIPSPESDHAVMLVRDRVSQFAGHAPALSIKSEEGKTVVASAEVVDLSAMQPEDTIFMPSPDMKRVTDMHTFKVTPAP